MTLKLAHNFLFNSDMRMENPTYDWLTSNQQVERRDRSWFQPQPRHVSSCFVCECYLVNTRIGDWLFNKLLQFIFQFQYDYATHEQIIYCLAGCKKSIFQFVITLTIFRVAPLFLEMKQTRRLLETFFSITKSKIVFCSSGLPFE